MAAAAAVCLHSVLALPLLPPLWPLPPDPLSPASGASSPILWPSDVPPHLGAPTSGLDTNLLRMTLLPPRSVCTTPPRDRGLAPGCWRLPCLGLPASGTSGLVAAAVMRHPVAGCRLVWLLVVGWFYVVGVYMCLLLGCVLAASPLTATTWSLVKPCLAAVLWRIVQPSLPWKVATRPSPTPPCPPSPPPLTLTPSSTDTAGGLGDLPLLRRPLPLPRRPQPPGQSAQSRPDFAGSLATLHLPSRPPSSHGDMAGGVGDLLQPLPTVTSPPPNIGVCPGPCGTCTPLPPFACLEAQGLQCSCC